MKVSIIRLTPDGGGEATTLEPNKIYLIGRDPSADFCIPETKVSRRHSSIFWDIQNGRILLEDLQSLNGTLLNGVPVPHVAEVHDKDRIVVGSAVFEVSAETAQEIKASAILEDDVPALPAENIEIEDSVPPPDPQYRTDGTSITGNLREIGLADLLQMLATTKKTGKLVVAPSRSQLSSSGGNESAVLWLNKGDLIGGSLKEFRGEEAVYELLRWKAGYFALYYREPVTKELNITMPMAALLIEGLRRLDEEKTLTVQFTPSQQFEVNSDSPLNLLDPDQLRVFQLVWKRKTVKAVWEYSHLDREQTNATLRFLLRSEYIKLMA